MAEFSDSGTPDGLWPYGSAAGDAEFTNSVVDGPNYIETEIIPGGEGLGGSPYQINLIRAAEIPDRLNEHSLAGWEQAEPLGKIEGSEWVNPVNGLQTLEDMHQLGGRITDEDVRMLADGRDQHLELFGLPEGYRYARIVDSSTGQVLTRPGDDRKYNGLSSCSCGTGHSAATFDSILNSQFIPLEGDKEITNIINLDKGTQTTVKPTEVDLHKPDYKSRSRTAARLLPDAREFHIETQAPVGTIHNANGTLTIKQDDTKTSGELVIYQTERDGHTVGGQIGLKLDGAGQIEKMQVYKSGLLRTLGIRTGAVFRGNRQATMREWATVTDPTQQQQIVEVLAEALGMDCWNGLNLRLTASGLYKAMGRRDLDLTSVLVPRS
jgi:hypothetical protein